MAYTIELSTKHLEPVQLEFMQGSISEEVTFILPGFEHESPPVSVLMKMKDPNGVLVFRAMTSNVFKASNDTFVVPGVYIGSICFTYQVQPEKSIFTFPIRIMVHPNPAMQMARTMIGKTVIGPNETVTVPTPTSVAPLGGYLYARIGDGIYQLTNGTAVSVPDSTAMIFSITYSSFNDEVQIENVSASTYSIEEAEFFLYGAATVGQKPTTKGINEEA